MATGGELIVSWMSDNQLDPMLEITVHDRQIPVSIRLIGMLNRASGRSLLSMVDDLIAEGARFFVMDAGGVAVDSGGRAALARCQRHVREAGGMLVCQALRSATA